MAVDIKQICDYSDKLRNVSYILTETVGTTTSYTFPEDTLLPYIKRNVKEYINNHWEDEKIKKMVVVLKQQAKVEMEEGWVGAVSIPEGDEVDINVIKDAVATYALNQIENSDLESLQNLIIKDGYSKGQLKGHLFPDVFPAFKKWTAEGKKIYMYSSGLELSQSCLIANSVEGDITELISGCFNSSEFPRTKSESFREMCKKVNSEPEKVVLLTDNAPTARAARKAGLVVIVLCREGNSYVGNCIRESFPVITSFDEISQFICAKRKKSSDESESPTGKKPKMDESITEEDSKVEEEKKEAEKKEENITEEIKTKAEGDKTEESSKSNEETPVVEDVKEPAKMESKMDVDVKESVSKEAAKEEEDVEMMEVDGVKAEEIKTKTEEESADIKIVVTPPEDVKADEEATTKETETKKDDIAKSKEEAEDKKIEEETKKEETTKEEEKEVVSVSAEDKKQEESVETVEEKKDDAKSEETKDVEETKDDESTVEKKEDEAEKEETKEKEEKVEEVEKVEEKHSPEKVCVIENGDAYVDDSNPSDDVTENGDAEKDEVRTNGVEHENGKVDDAKDTVESTEKESVKAVPKKAEVEESVTDAPATQ